MRDAFPAVAPEAAGRSLDRSGVPIPRRLRRAVALRKPGCRSEKHGGLRYDFRRREVQFGNGVSDPAVKGRPEARLYSKEGQLREPLGSRPPNNKGRLAAALTDS